MSESRSEGRQNSGDKAFHGLPVGPGEADRFAAFLAAHDFSVNTRRAFSQDARAFVSWFTAANHEPFTVARVTTRDVTDFRDHLCREGGKAVATVNRALVTIRLYFGWLVETGVIEANPAARVKELRRVQLAPKSLDRGQVRKLLREVELRQDVRANAVVHLFLYTGCRVGDLVTLELHDLMLGERAGSVVFRLGKGGKQRSVPLPLPARRAIQEYLEARPPVETDRVFLGERGGVDRPRGACPSRQVRGPHGHWPAPALAAAHLCPPVPHRLRERPRGAGPDTRPRVVEHDSEVHETVRRGVGSDRREADVLREECWANVPHSTATIWLKSSMTRS